MYTELQKTCIILEVMIAFLYTQKILYSMKVLLGWHVCILGARIVQSVLLLATGWVVQRSSAPIQTGSGAYTISYAVGTE